MLYRDGWGRMKAVHLRQEYDKLLNKLNPASIPLHFKEEIETMIIKQRVSKSFFAYSRHEFFPACARTGGTVYADCLLFQNSHQRRWLVPIVENHAIESNHRAPQSHIPDAPAAIVVKYRRSRCKFSLDGRFSTCEMKQFRCSNSGTGLVYVLWMVVRGPIYFRYVFDICWFDRFPIDFLSIDVRQVFDR